MSSGGADPKAVNQAAGQDGQGESSEQLTQFVSDYLTIGSREVITLQSSIGTTVIKKKLLFSFPHTYAVTGRRTSRKYGRSEGSTFMNISILTYTAMTFSSFPSILSASPPPLNLLHPSPFSHTHSNKSLSKCLTRS